VYNFGVIQSRNPRVYTVNNSTFCNDTAKSANHAKYLTMSWTYLKLLYRFGRRIGGDDYPNIRLAVAHGTLLWQPVKVRRPLLFALVFDNRSADSKSFKRFSGKNQAISCTNLVNFRPIISELYDVKMHNFAVIHPQFDDNLQSSHRRSEQIGRSQF